MVKAGGKGKAVNGREGNAAGESWKKRHGSNRKVPQRKSVPERGDKDRGRNVS